MVNNSPNQLLEPAGHTLIQIVMFQSRNFEQDLSLLVITGQSQVKGTQVNLRTKSFKISQISSGWLKSKSWRFGKLWQSWLALLAYPLLILSAPSARIKAWSCFLTKAAVSSSKVCLQALICSNQVLHKVARAFVFWKRLEDGGFSTLVAAKSPRLSDRHCSINESWLFSWFFWLISTKRWGISA